MIRPSSDTVPDSYAASAASKMRLVHVCSTFFTSQEIKILLELDHPSVLKMYEFYISAPPIATLLCIRSLSLTPVLVPTASVDPPAREQPAALFNAVRASYAWANCVRIATMAAAQLSSSRSCPCSMRRGTSACQLLERSGTASKWRTNDEAMRRSLTRTRGSLVLVTANRRLRRQGVPCD